MDLYRLPRLMLYFEGGNHDTYINPTNYVCRSFNCPNMPKVTAIVWKNLPLHKVAAFYETPDCTYRDGYFTFNTGSTRTQVSGRQPYEGHPKRIRSMMLGRNEAALLEEKLKKPTSISHTCNLIRNGLFDTTTLGANETQSNATYEVQWMNDEGSFGGLSANWSDSLPDGSD